MTDPIADLIAKLAAKSEHYADTDSPLRTLCAEAADYLESLRTAIREACQLIERGDRQNNGMGGFPSEFAPKLTPLEWTTLYATLHEAVTLSIEPDEADYPGKYHGHAR